MGLQWAREIKECFLKINNKPISTEEFVRIYEKNNKNLFDESKKADAKRIFGIIRQL